MAHNNAESTVQVEIPVSVDIVLDSTYEEGISLFLMMGFVASTPSLEEKATLLFERTSFEKLLAMTSMEWK